MYPHPRQQLTYNSVLFELLQCIHTLDNNLHTTLCYLSCCTVSTPSRTTYIQHCAIGAVAVYPHPREQLTYNTVLFELLQCIHTLENNLHTTLCYLSCCSVSTPSRTIYIQHCAIRAVAVYPHPPEQLTYNTVLFELLQCIHTLQNNLHTTLCYLSCCSVSTPSTTTSQRSCIKLVFDFKTRFRVGSLISLLCKQRLRLSQRRRPRSYTDLSDL